MAGRAFAGHDRHSPQGECTIGVFGGVISDGGRPILWKNRDVGDHDQRFIFYAPYQRDSITTLAFIGDVYRSDTTRVYMGANATGFAIMNSDSYNLNDSLSGGMDDGTLMRLALETCSSLRDFELLLDSTNIIGRRDCWNFGVLDASGACALYECANRSYYRFIPGADDSLAGYVIRANFSLSGGNNLVGLDRYRRAVDLTVRQIERGPINADFVLKDLARDLANLYDDPYPLPYHRSQENGPPGYIYNFGCTIANTSTSSAVAIVGLLPGEDPELATIYALLGPPVLSVSFPLWVKSGTVPVYLSRPNGAPVKLFCDQRRQYLYDDPNSYFYINSRYLLDDDGRGVYSYTLPLEAWGISEANELLAQWRAESPSASDVQFEQFRIATAIFTGFQLETANFLQLPSEQGPVLPNKISMSNYPNPFNLQTRIILEGIGNDFPAALRIYDCLGRLVYQISGTNALRNGVIWTGENMSGHHVSSGVYFYSLSYGPHHISNKMTLIK